jgi:hypothetical protein
MLVKPYILFLPLNYVLLDFIFITIIIINFCQELQWTDLIIIITHYNMYCIVVNSYVLLSHL